MSSTSNHLIGYMIGSEIYDAFKRRKSAKRGFDWDNPVLQDELSKTIKTFYKSQGLEWKKGDLKERFPEKEKALSALDRMADEGRISELEYLALCKEILAPKEAAVS